VSDTCHRTFVVAIVLGERADGVPVEADGRPRGSFNRWNYNEVYRSASPLSGGTVRQTIRSRDADAMPNSDTQYYRRYQSEKSMRTYSTTPAPTPGHRVELEAKHDIDWAYDGLTFYLRVSLLAISLVLLHCTHKNVPICF